MMQEGEEEDLGNEYLYPEEDLQAHSTRAEEFNFSELIKSIEGRLLNFCK